jgi:hypothetical protein
MSIDTQKDVPLSAIAALVRAAITAELGPGMVVKCYEDPRTLQVMAAADLPALCIYRKRRKSRRESSTNRVQDITVFFQYVLPATTLDKRKNRWPALDAVWDVIETVVLDGGHESVSGGADVLAAAGVQGQEDTAQCENAFSEGGSETVPIFVGSIVVTYTPDTIDLTTLHPFLEFYAAFDGYENPEVADQTNNPFTNDLVTLQGYPVP